MPGGRPRGARSYKAASLRLLLGRMESERALTPRRIIERLQQIAESDAPDRVPALRLLAAYLRGFPVGRLDVPQQHDLGPGVVELLTRIAESPEHRAHLESLERHRLKAAAVTTEVVADS